MILHFLRNRRNRYCKANSWHKVSQTLVPTCTVLALPRLHVSSSCSLGPKGEDNALGIHRVAPEIALKVIQFCFCLSFPKAFSAMSFAPIMTKGTPFPGRVLAPQKRTLDKPDETGPGRVKLSWAKP